MPSFNAPEPGSSRARQAAVPHRDTQSDTRADIRSDTQDATRAGVSEPVVPTTLQFSLLLPVWDGDDPGHLAAAFDSAVITQTCRPDEVVIVRDGPVSETMTQQLSALATSSPVPVVIVELEHNSGLGPALDAGLARCSHDVVARMDADDIAVPDRFERQLPLMHWADIAGAGLLEFDGTVDNIVGQRTPPVGTAEIAAYARVHDPFNHPTVVYRRSAVIAAGGYGDLPMMEDYWLFARMLRGGATAVNIPDPLVYYRVGADAFRRRGGWVLLKSEVRLQRRLLDEGFVSRVEFARNLVMRCAYRLVPWQVRRGLYRAFVRGHDSGPHTGRLNSGPLTTGPLDTGTRGIGTSA